jgi:hypothetical protein
MHANFERSVERHLTMLRERSLREIEAETTAKRLGWLEGRADRFASTTPRLLFETLFLEGGKIAAMAEAYNMRVSPHNCASALSTAASLQLSTCIANFMNLEIYPYFPQKPGYVQVLKDSPEDRIAKGFLPLDDAPGLGVELASERVRPFLFAESR